MELRPTYRYGSVLLILLSAVFGASCRTHAELGSNEDTFEKLAKATQAREFFKAGESAYKVGNLETAAAYWLKTLEVKPDSDYTKQCLTKAQKQLLATYGQYTSRQLASQDRVSAYLSLKSLCNYIPSDPSLTAKADAIKSKMTGNELKAIQAYDDAAFYYQSRSYSKARESILEARGLAAGSETLKLAAATIQKAYNANPPPPPKKVEPQPESQPQQMAEAGTQQPGRGPVIGSSNQAQQGPVFQPLFSPTSSSSRSTPQRGRTQISARPSAPSISRCPPIRRSGST
jgi:tetratricopeptide (TPR) repeat protein